MAVMTSVAALVDGLSNKTRMDGAAEGKEMGKSRKKSLQAPRNAAGEIAEALTRPKPPNDKGREADVAQ